MLKELLSAEKSKKKGRGVLLPRLNSFLTSLDSRKLRYPAWTTRHEKEERRKDKRFHPSSLSRDWCERKWVFENYELVKTHKEEPSAALQRIFQTGDVYHTMVQRWLAEMGGLYGMWRCARCDAHFWAVSPKKCVHCGWSSRKALLVFHEVPIDHADSNVLGHDDGEFDISPEERVLVEVKSMNARNFASYKNRPMEDHVEQALHYLHIRSSKMGAQLNLGETLETFKPMRRAVLLYVNKDTSDIREFVLTLSASNVDAYLTPRLRQMEKARAYRDGNLKTLPKRTCKSLVEGKLRDCELASVCFKDFPPFKKSKE